MEVRTGHHFAPSFLLLLCLAAGPLPVLAAAPDASGPFGARPDAVSLAESYRLPGIFATDLEFTRAGRTVRGTFILENAEENILGGMQYHVELWDGEERVLWERHAVREAQLLAAGEKRTIAFAHAFRAVPAGAYTLRIQAVTAKGRMLGWADAPVTFAGVPDRFVRLEELSVSPAEFAGEEFDALSGPNVAPGGMLTLHATAVNAGRTPVTVVPSAEEFVFDMARGESRAIPFPALTLQPGERRRMALELHAADRPEVYAAMLRLRDDRGAIVSNDAEYRWVVRGADADVFPMRIRQMAYKAGGAVLADADIVGAADAATVTEATVRFALVDAHGTVTATETPLALTDRITSGMAELALSRDLSMDPRIEVTVTAADGAVLERHVEPLPAPEPAPSPRMLGLTRRIWILLGLAAACMALAVRQRVSRTPRALPPEIAGA